MQLLAKIISEIEIGETEDVASESHAQEAAWEDVHCHTRVIVAP